MLPALACKAQSPIEPLYNNSKLGDAEDTYYKDLNNDFNNFEGTWQYTNGNDTLTIVLQKKVMQYIDNSSSPMLGKSYYKDLLVGEYRYVESGIEKVNTLPNLQINHNSTREYNLRGDRMQKYNPNAASGYCLGCNPGEVKVFLIFSEPNVNIRGSRMYYNFRYFVENGVEKLELTMSDHGMISHDVGTNNINDEHSIPYRDFILVKQ